MASDATTKNHPPDTDIIVFENKRDCMKCRIDVHQV